MKMKVYMVVFGGMFLLNFLVGCSDPEEYQGENVPENYQNEEISLQEGEIPTMDEENLNRSETDSNALIESPDFDESKSGQDMGQEKYIATRDLQEDLLLSEMNKNEKYGYGATGALASSQLSLEEMLNYAIQDEYLARSEYQIIMERFDVDRPFSNIKKSEEMHIQLLVPLFEKYEFSVPKDTSKEHLVIPDNLKEIYEIGVQAEIKNIEMYEHFLEHDLPMDVEEVFIELRDGSKNHLNAFQKNLDKFE